MIANFAKLQLQLLQLFALQIAIAKKCCIVQSYLISCANCNCIAIATILCKLQTSFAKCNTFLQTSFAKYTGFAMGVRKNG